MIIIIYKVFFEVSNAFVIICFRCIAFNCFCWKSQLDNCSKDALN